jgi:hypothetical protein
LLKRYNADGWTSDSKWNQTRLNKL